VSLRLSVSDDLDLKLFGTRLAAQVDRQALTIVANSKNRLLNSVGLLVLT
jgi:hypothetical protein